VTHTDAVYLIDRRGRERVLLRTDALDEVPATHRRPRRGAAERPADLDRRI